MPSLLRRILISILIAVPVLLLLIEMFSPISLLGLLLGPSTLRTVIDPISNPPQTLSAALVDVARNSFKERSGVYFMLSPADAQLSVTLQMTKPASLKSVLNDLANQTNREIHYGTCGTCGGIIGGIHFTPHGVNPWYKNQNNVDVDENGIRIR